MRYLLALLIFVLTVANVFDWTLSLAPGLSIKNAVMYLILLALAGRFAVRGGLRMELPQLHLWLGILIAYATLSWLVVGVVVQYTSYTLLSSGIDLKGNLLDIVLIFVMYLYGTRTLGDATFVLKCLLLTVSAANAIAIGNVTGLFEIGVTVIGTGFNEGGRVFGAFGHANETAALTACLLPAYVAATLSSRGVARIFWALAGTATATVLIMTGSRGAFVGLALAAVFGTYVCRAIISWRRAATLALILAPLAVATVAFTSLMFGGVLEHRVVAMILNPDPRGEDRTYIWMQPLAMMMAHPVTLFTGFGWAAYDVMGFTYVAHNHYLLLWFELGIIGLGCYLLAMVQIVITARRAANNAPEDTARYLIAFIYGTFALSGAIFFTLLFKPWPYIWIYNGLTMRMALIALQTAKPNAPNERRGANTVSSLPAVARPAASRLSATQPPGGCP